MKTTFDLPDPLVRHAKMPAARRGTTMRELVIEGLQRVFENHGGPAGRGFVLKEDEAEVVAIGANGLPVLKRPAGCHKPAVTNETVNRLRADLII